MNKKWPTIRSQNYTVISFLFIGKMPHFQRIHQILAQSKRENQPMVRSEQLCFPRKKPLKKSFKGFAFF